MIKINLLKLWAVSIAALFMSCGQDPAFLELEGQGGNSTSRSATIGESSDEGLDATDSEFDPDAPGANDDGSNPDPDSIVDLDGDGWPDDAVDPSDGMNDGMTPEDPMGPGAGNGGDTPSVDIPDADPTDLGDIERCLALWGDNSPFGQTITNYEKIYASVTIGGSGTPINDTVRTEEPKLILVVAGVAVGSNVTYNMLNPNGYYCVKVSVNVQTNATYNVHCNAAVAQSSVSVNVGSNGDPLSQIGVNVNSNTQVNIVRPADDQCRM